MKDLKHLIYFENLLQDAQNELVDQAKAAGQYALGYNCYYIPEVLLNLPGCFSSRLRAPRCTSTDIAGYYMTNRSCPYARSILERAIEGGYNYLDALFGAESCATMDRMESHFFLINPVKNDRFFVTQVDPPMKGDSINLEYYKVQLRVKVLEPLKERLGVDVSDEPIRTAVEKHNRLCRVITEIGSLRKLPNPPITGYEFHVIQLVSQVCPHDLILPYLEETLEELKTREPEEKFPFRTRVVLVGSEIDDPEFTKLIETCGAMVVADRYCFGSFPSREEIEIRDGESAFDAICRTYLHWNQCARFMDGMKIDQRHDEVERLVKEFGAEDIIYENMKFCEFRIIDLAADQNHSGAERELRLRLTRFQLFQCFFQIRKDQIMGTDLAYQLHHMELISGNRRIRKLTEGPDLRNHAAEAVMFLYGDAQRLL